LRRASNVPTESRLASGLAARGAAAAGLARSAAARAAASKRLMGALEAGAGAVAGTVGAVACVEGERGACGNGC
jgi:hypothetical protein